ncbi:MAG TPA: adenylate cyclase [Thermoplasmata archaeon]|nr:adenylate cyclase [Thermoplasmata archaeon]
MRKFALGIASAAILLSIAGFAAADRSPNGPGQPGAPNNTCGPQNPVTPGASANASGAPFNPNGTAGANYAGNPGTASSAHSNSNKSVSQYDAACFQVSH